MKILATTAGSLPAKRKAEYLFEICEKLSAELIVLHVIRETDNYSDGERALDIFRARTNQQVRAIMRIGGLSETIAKVAEEYAVNLVILGIDPKSELANQISGDVYNGTGIPVLIVPTLTRE